MQRIRQGLRDHDHLAMMVGALLGIYVPEQKEERDIEKQKSRVREEPAWRGYRLVHGRGPTILVDAIDPANPRPIRDVVRGCQ
jgi:hypothetical protein